MLQIEEDCRTRVLKKQQQESVVSSIKQKYEAYAEIEIGKTLDKLPLFSPRSPTMQAIMNPKPDRTKLQRKEERPAPMTI